MTLLMTYGADILVTLASLGAMAYCMILSRRLSRLTSFDKGLGGAIAVMSSQVDEMKSALKEAKAGSDGAGSHLSDLVVQARDISTELEMMIAACHDFAEEAISVQSSAPEEDSTAIVDDTASADLVEEIEVVEPAPEDTVLDTAEEEPPAPIAEEEAEIPTEGSVTPMFGSRRATAAKARNEEEDATVEPLFRRRRAAG